MFADEIRRKRVQNISAYSNWQWNLDEVFVNVDGDTHFLWRAVDHDGEVLKTYRPNVGS
jgi:putative transposase